jgi:hypothetical protein
MQGFAELLEGAERLSDGRAVEVHETWLQGRTAYGGYTSALTLAEAMRVGGAELPPLRSAQFAMMAPLAGRIEVRARVQRRGRNATWIAAELSGEKGVGFTASFVFMSPVVNAVTIDQGGPARALTPASEAPPLTFDEAPAFLKHHFDVRRASPDAGMAAHELLWWVRPRDHAALHPMVSLMLTADAAPPSILLQLPQRVPISTMHWHVNVLALDPSTDDGWWLLQSESEHSRGGLSSERMRAWNSRSEPVLAELQSVAVFG